MPRKLFASRRRYAAPRASNADALAHQLCAGGLDVTCNWLACRYTRKTGNNNTSNSQLGLPFSE